MHSNPDMLGFLLTHGGACLMGAHVLSFTAPCRSADVESMVKVSFEWAHSEWSVYIYTAHYISIYVYTSTDKQDF